jgi:serine/threonine protein phosphatase 1
MRTLAIGDIHGCFTALLAVADAAEITTDDRLVTLGDYVDRGSEVPQVLGWLRDRYRAGNLVPLLGNHELMLQAGRENTDAYECWLASGGRDTLLAYAPSGMEPSLEHFPQEDWEFIENDCVPWYETEKHIFVHATLHPGLPLARQYEQVLFWDRCLTHPPHCSGKIMVCGHTPQPSGLPTNYGHAICLDTGVYLDGGWLTCLDITTGEYWQANQTGATRHWELSEPEPS